MRFASKIRSHCLSLLPHLDTTTGGSFHADPINRRTHACAYERYSLRKALSNAEPSQLGPWYLES